MLSFKHTKQSSKNVVDTTFKENYPARSKTCFTCEKTRHFSRHCINTKNVREIKARIKEQEEQTDQEKIYKINLFKTLYSQKVQ